MKKTLILFDFIVIVIIGYILFHLALLGLVSLVLYPILNIALYIKYKYFSISNHQAIVKELAELGIHQLTFSIKDQCFKIERINNSFEINISLEYLDDAMSYEVSRIVKNKIKNLLNHHATITNMFLMDANIKQNECAKTIETIFLIMQKMDKYECSVIEIKDGKIATTLRTNIFICFLTMSKYSVANMALVPKFIKSFYLYSVLFCQQRIEEWV